jgi:hypothetical protein
MQTWGKSSPLRKHFQSLQSAFPCFAMASVASPRASSCTHVRDCSLSGDCVRGVCVCKPWWRGTACEQLNLVPAHSITDGIFLPGVSTWGGSAVRTAGITHAFASEMSHHCGVAAWERNSRCVHLSARDPAGPYTRHGIAMPTWCHNPRCPHVRPSIDLH